MTQRFSSTSSFLSHSLCRFYFFPPYSYQMLSSLNNYISRSQTQSRFYLYLKMYLALTYGNFFFFLSFLGPLPQHMEVPRPGFELELRLPATATAKPYLNHICDLNHSSQQHQILNPTSEARELNLCPYEQQLGSLPLSHNRNSQGMLL